MSFWRRVGLKSKPNSDNSGKRNSLSITKSTSLFGLNSDSSGRPASIDKHGCLADFLREIQSPDGSYNDKGDKSVTSWETLFQQKSRLSKTVEEFLGDPCSMGYLLQYLETRNMGHVIKFWLEVESFRSSVCDTTNASRDVGEDRLSHGDKSQVEPCPKTPEISPTSEFIPEEPGGMVEFTESYDSGYSRSDCSSVTCEPIQTDHKPSDKSYQQDEAAAICDGFNKIFGERNKVADSGRHHLSPALAADRSPIHPTNNNNQARTEDAVKIYRKYIAPDGQLPVSLPVEVKKEIVELICDETGLVSPNCFDQAQRSVLEMLQTEYFTDFLHSQYNAKHQVDLLTGGQVSLMDILFNDTALFHFMEFMESEGERAVVEFWMAANNFQQSILMSTSENGRSSRASSHQDGDHISLKDNEALMDAMVLYDKFFSMQATNHLGFEDNMRICIERNICQDGGPAVDCFARPLELVASYMEQKFLQKFLNSKLFQNYVKELISTIQSPPPSTSTTMQRFPSSESINSCQSDRTNISKLSSGCARTTGKANTLLATGGKLDNFGLRIDSQMLIDPDSLWRRTSSRNSMGRVDSLGRYRPGWEEAPDPHKEGVLSKAARAIRGDGVEQTRLREEMAWQVAEMFVKEVTSITQSTDNICSSSMHEAASAATNTNINNNNNNHLQWDLSCLPDSSDSEEESSCSGGDTVGSQSSRQGHFQRYLSPGGHQAAVAANSTPKAVVHPAPSTPKSLSGLHQVFSSPKSPGLQLFSPSKTASTPHLVSPHKSSVP